MCFLEELRYVIDLKKFLYKNLAKILGKLLFEIFFSSIFSKIGLKYSEFRTNFISNIDFVILPHAYKK